jgi:hypothetical protein
MRRLGNQAQGRESQAGVGCWAAGMTILLSQLHTVINECLRAFSALKVLKTPKPQESRVGSLPFVQGKERG